MTNSKPRSKKRPIVEREVNTIKQGDLLVTKTDKSGHMALAAEPVTAVDWSRRKEFAKVSTKNSTGIYSRGGRYASVAF